MQRLLAIAFCITVAWLVAMGMTLVMYFSYWPPRWNNTEPEYLFAIALLGALYIAAVPLLALGGIALRRLPGTLLCTSVTTLWLLLVFIFRATKPWGYYGEFPWWMLQRDFVQQLPASLAVGLAFGLVAHKVLGPNNSFKPKPLRGSA